MTEHERRVPAFYQIPILLLAFVLAIVALGLAVYEHAGSITSPWLTGAPFAGAVAALTLIIADVIKHQHLSGEHVKTLALGLAPIGVGLFAWTLAYGIFIAVALVIISVLAAVT